MTATRGKKKRKMDELIMELSMLTNLFFTSPGFALWLGVMIAVAIFLGYFVFEDTRKLWSWMMVFVVYLIFQELMRMSYFSALPDSPLLDPYRPIFLVFISSIIFGLGLFIGGYIAHRSKMRRAAIRNDADKIIEEIKTNGGDSYLNSCSKEKN